MKKVGNRGIGRTGQWSDGSKRLEDDCNGVVCASKLERERMWSGSKMTELAILEVEQFMLMTRSKGVTWEWMVQIKDKVIGEKVRDPGNKGKVSPILMVLQQGIWQDFIYVFFFLKKK